MPRKIIPLVTGECYHIFNRGVDKRTIFETESDYMRFYVTLRDFNRYEPVGSLRDLHSLPQQNKTDVLVAIKAYALLPNHFHLLVQQRIEGGISEFLKRIQGGYTAYFNEMHHRSGSLLQGTFKRAHVESDEYFNYLFSYINENHTVHGLTLERKIYHSSSLHYQNLVRSKIISGNESDQQNYDIASATMIAKDVFKRRLELKNLLHEV